LPVPCSFVPPYDQAPPATVAVRRSGFAGVVGSGELDPESDPEGPEVRLLLSRLQVRPIQAEPPKSRGLGPEPGSI
jgi:hypothetical protein